MVQPNVGFHESFNPPSKLAFVLSTENVHLLWSKGHSSRCAWCRRDDFENVFAASKTDFACWSRQWAFHRRCGQIGRRDSCYTSMCSNIDHPFLLLVLKLEIFRMCHTFSEW